jgi:hypothetical protein
MATVKTREKRRAARLRKNEKIQKQIDDLAELINEDDGGDEEEVIAEKDYGMEPAMAVMPPLATSFEELDAMELAREQADAVREVTWQVSDLVHNILYSDMKPKEKATAIKSVADEFPRRVEMEVSDEMEKSIDDMDLLELEALIAKDNRRLTVFERLSDFIEKKKLTARAENALSSEQFALVYEEGGKPVRKYPIHDKAHVRNALARAAQMINSGGKAAEDARKALPKIRAAAKKMGIGAAEKERSAVVVEKDASGGWRAVMWPSNNFKDLDGEIISEKAHQEYVEWVNKNMDVAPVFLTWHKAGTRRAAQVDFAGYEHGFLIMSAPLTEKEAAGLLRAQALTDVGMSHGSFVLERDGSDPLVITKYRMVEVSDLPIENAANPFTDFETLLKEADMDTKQYLASVLGSDEEAEKHMKKMLEKQEALRKAGVEEKASDPPAEPVAETKTAEAPNIDEIVARVAKELGMDQLSVEFAVLKEAAEKVPVLESLVAELTTKSDEKLAEMIAPKIAKSFSWMDARPSQSEKTVLKDEDKGDAKLKEAKPETGWLSELTGTTPLQ